MWEGEVDDIQLSARLGAIPGLPVALPRFGLYIGAFIADVTLDSRSGSHDGNNLLAGGAEEVGLADGYFEFGHGMRWAIATEPTAARQNRFAASGYRSRHRLRVTKRRNKSTGGLWKEKPSQTDGRVKNQSGLWA
jgi:hypothetical protein